MKSAFRHSASSVSTHRKINTIIASEWRPESGYSPRRWLRLQNQLRRKRRSYRQEAERCEC